MEGIALGDGLWLWLAQRNMCARCGEAEWEAPMESNLRIRGHGASALHRLDDDDADEMMMMRDQGIAELLIRVAIYDGLCSLSSVE